MQSSLFHTILIIVIPSLIMIPPETHSSPSPIIIGISGPTTSGKTTLSQLLSQRLGCPVLHQDKYFHAERIKTQLNYNCEVPEAIDQERFYADILTLVATNNLFIVEGFQIFSTKQVVDILRVKIYLDIDEDTIRTRRMVVNPCSVGHFQQRILPSVRQYKARCQMIEGIEFISGTLKIKEVLEKCLQICKKAIPPQTH